MNPLLARLGPKERRGSKPRCHWLTHGAPAAVAERLNALASPWATVCPTDRWMPEGFEVTQEAELPKASRLLDIDLRRRLSQWWLPAGHENAKTPNFDIASTCTIEGAPGLLLVEAKAHRVELEGEAGGRRLPAKASADSEASHQTIGAAISAARNGLSAATELDWSISRDSHYQMSNRFAWSWKLAESRIPVVLIYLGFLGADEMVDRGKPFPDHHGWETLVKEHSAPLFSATVWNRRWTVDGVPLVPLIRAMEQPLDPEAGV
jgi:hypothetical protein